MRQIRISLSAATVLALLSTFSFAQFRTVTVQNASNNPVPTTVTNTPTVTGTVTVNNTVGNPVPVAGNVGITGTPAVTISGTPTVNAGNLPLTNNGGTANGAVAFKNVDEPSRHAFQTFLHCSFASATSCTANFVVPAGKVFVIEYINLLNTGPNVADETLQTTAGGNLIFYFYPPGQGIAFTNVFLYSQQVRIYADPGSTISFTGSETTTTFGDFGARLSGYLLDVP